MSDEFNNRDHMEFGNSGDTEENTNKKITNEIITNEIITNEVIANKETAEEEEIANSEITGENVVKTENVQEHREPGEAPTLENSCYAHSYRRAQREEQREEQKEETKRENYGSYQFASQIPPERPERKPRKRSSKKNSTVKKFGTVAAMAAVFGLVAGGVFQAVNYTAGKFMPEETPKIASTQVAGETVSDIKNTDSDTGSYGSVSQVAQNVMQSVVSITGISVQEIPNYFGFGTQQYETPNSGSGIIVGQNDEELLIATNNHVVASANSLTVCFTNQDGTAASTNILDNTSTDSETSEELAAGTAVAAQIKGTDADNDLAVIAVKLSDIPKDVLSQIKVATMGDSDSLIIGEQVVAIGNALGYGQSVTSGYVSALNKRVSSESANSTFIQTDTAINPGNSGGALLNMKGEVIGINSAKIADNKVEGMGFAIPISRAQPILDELMSKKTRNRVEDKDKAAYLGITCQDVSSTASKMYNIPIGVFVESIEEGGPADDAGIKVGDIIRKIDGTTVESYKNLVEKLQYFEAGEEIEFLISRADSGQYKEESITVKLGARKDAPATAENYRKER